MSSSTVEISSFVLARLLRISCQVRSVLLISLLKRLGNHKEQQIAILAKNLADRVQRRNSNALLLAEFRDVFLVISEVMQKPYNEHHTASSDFLILVKDNISRNLRSQSFSRHLKKNVLSKGGRQGSQLSE